MTQASKTMQATYKSEQEGSAASLAEIFLMHKKALSCFM